MGVDWSRNGVATASGMNNLTDGFGMLTKAWSNLEILEMSIGGAYRFNGKLSIGFAPVFAYQTMGLEMDFNTTGMPPGTPNPYKASLDNANAYGVGFDLGAVYKINEIVQFGFVYKSKRWMQKLEWNTTPDNMMFNSDKVKMRLDMPRQLALGINIRPIRQLRLETDVRWINYHDVMNEVDISGMNQPSPNGMVPMKTWNFHWKNQWVFAMGAEFYATRALTLRAGFNYAKSQIKDKDLYNNIITPAIVQTHVAAGASYKFNKNLELSFAYVHAFEHKQKGSVPSQYQHFYGRNVEIKMHQDIFSLEVTYNF